MPQLWKDVDVPSALELIRASYDRPWVQQMYPPSVTSAISNLWQERETWLGNLYDRLPQTFGHLDAARVNLLSRSLSDGTNEIIAIDWQLSGIGAIGQELSPMIFMSTAMGNVEIDKIHELEKNHFRRLRRRFTRCGMARRCANGKVRIYRSEYCFLYPAETRRSLCCRHCR